MELSSGWRGVRYLAFGASILLIVSMLWAITSVSSAAAAVGDPFGAQRPTVLVAQSPAGEGTNLYRAETANDGSFGFFPEGTDSSGLYNAISWRPADGYVYGMVVEAIGAIPSGSLIRIGEGGAVTRVGTARYSHTGDPGRQYAWYAGAFSPDDGFLYVADGGGANNPVTVIDVSSGAVVRTFDLSPAIAAGQDFEFLGGYLWSMTATGAVQRIDVATGAVTVFAAVGPADSGGYGGAWRFGNGNLGFSGNDTGDIVQLQIADPASAAPAFSIVAVSPGPSSANNDGTAIPGDPVDLSIVKSGPAQFTPGEQIAYTLTVTNEGGGESSGWHVTDSMPTGLVAQSATGTAGSSCSIAGGGQDISCHGGRLSVGQSVTITVVVGTDAATVTPCITNVADVLGNESDPDPADNRSQSTSCTPGELVVVKSVNPSSGSPVGVGQSVTYTVALQNIGGSPVSVAQDDVIAGVLDDAVIVDEPVSSDPALSVTAISAGRFSISGTLAALQTVSISYTVRVLPDSERGDDLLANFVVASGGTPPAVCAAGDLLCTQNPVAGYSIVKSASAPSAVPGDVITYSITVSNTGRVDYSAADPASFVDDLTDVLDDATYNGDASSGAVFTAPQLSWEGALPIGGTVVVRYSVTVDESNPGDLQLTNTVAPTGIGGECASPTGCTTVTPIGSYTIAKTVDADTARPGQKVTYTITVTNTGRLDYTEGAPASFTDDLSGVLDDATYDDDATQGAVVLGDTLFWSGALPVESTVQIRYSVTVDESRAGDRMLHNVAIPTGPEGSCAGTCRTATAVMSYAVTKTASVSEVDPGGTVMYTITVKNTGRADYTDVDPASFTDDLTRALTQADYNRDADSGAVFASPVISWAGPLEVGGSVSITYSMTVKPGASGHLLNVVVTPPSSGGNCGESTRNPDCRVTTPISPVGAQVSTGGHTASSLAKAGWTGLIWISVFLACTIGLIIGRARRRARL
ncbi:DUF6923 family protein [Microbacterium maritypicum]|uniref:DUF7927 domain-containing protein n=1 Tax=Microbacterium maritypicum TaxID=33918 RepID=UPI003CEBEF8E